MLFLPNVGEHDELDADEAEGAVRERFVDQRFRFICLKYAGGDASRLNEMQSAEWVERSESEEKRKGAQDAGQFSAATAALEASSQ